MEEALHLTLFGGMQALLGGSPLDLPYTKSMTLLSYLAITGRPHSREVLSTLLWGESNDDRARASLRTAIWHLNEAVGPFLIADRQSVAFNRRAPHWVDVVEFGERIEGVLRETSRAEDRSPAAPSAERQANVLSEAVELYRGELLAGCTVRHAPVFEDWLLRKREWARELAVRALQHLVQHYKSTGDYAAGLDAVAQLLVVAPWQEEAHRQRMTLLDLSGQRNAALAQYHTCRQVLAEFLDTEPTLETELLYRKIKAGRPPAIGRGSPRPLHLHLPLWCLGTHLQKQVLVGRDSELARLKGLLASPDDVLVSLVGPDGVGKTRLACTVAGEVGRRFEHGVWFVSAEPALPDTGWKGHQEALPDDRSGFGQDEASTLAAAIGRVLGVTFCTRRSIATQLEDYLRHRELLLVLDGLECSIDEVDLISRLLDQAPSLKVLVTEAEPLGLEREQVLSLGGLAAPGLPADRAGAVQQLEQVSACDAVCLFSERARAASPGFQLTPDNVGQVVRLCRLTAGLPLAIELVAAWAGRSSLAAMADGIEWRQRKMRGRRRASGSLPLEAVCSYVWDLLSSGQQADLLRLSCLGGDFDEEAVFHVVGLTGRRLKVLCQRGFLTRTPAERYHMHPVVQRLLLSKLPGRMSSEEIWDAGVNPGHLEKRKSCWYLASLERAEDALRGPRAKSVRSELKCDWQHIGRAWRWAASHADWDRLAGSLASLSWFLLLEGWSREGVELLDAALDALRAEEETLGNESSARLACRLLREKARHLNAQLRYDEAVEAAQSVIELVDSGAIPGAENAAWQAVRASAQLEWGRALHPGGELAAAEAHIEQALALGEDEGCAEVKASSLWHLGMIEAEREHFDEACRHLEEALALYEQLGDLPGRGRTLSALGLARIARRQFEEAENQVTEALAIARSMGDGSGKALAHATLCRIGRACQDRLAAAVHCRHGLLAARDVGEPRRESQALRETAWLLLDEGEASHAWSYSLLAAELARLVGHADDEAQAWLLAGHALAELDVPDQAKHACREALRIQRQLGQLDAAAESIAQLASVSLSEGDIERAKTLVEEILDHVDSSDLGGARDPAAVYLTCYQVLTVAEDERAHDMLQLVSSVFQGTR